MQAVRTTSVIGLTAQVALLAVLAASVGLSPIGWLIGVACGVTANATLASALTGAGAAALGPANRVTLTRVTLVGGVAALAADAFHRSAAVTPLVALAVAALVLDAVDGLVARQTASASAIGARFDMEVDAFLILVLSAYVARSVGPWVLTIGVARYAFVAAGWLLPWLREPLRPRYWRKTVAAIQGIVLAVAAADVLPDLEIGIALAAALILLVESFGRDTWWLWRDYAQGSSRAQTAGMFS